jgi:hypothetical protein
MKKIIFPLFAIILCLPLVSFANSPDKISFRAISSASPVTCKVLGMPSESLAKNDNGQFLQAFRPRASKSRVLSLGTKGMVNYSTTQVSYFLVQCHTNNVASTPVDVKVFMDAVETYFFTVGSTPWGFAIGQ